MSIETNAQGGQGSALESGFHLGFPTRGVLAVAAVVKQGALRYETNNWRLVTAEEHYNHAVEHAMRLGDPLDPSNDPHSPAYEDHAAHAATRLLMFLETRKPGMPLAFHVAAKPPAPVQTGLRLVGQPLRRDFVPIGDPPHRATRLFPQYVQ